MHNTHTIPVWVFDEDFLCKKLLSNALVTGLVFWDRHDILFVDYLNSGKTIQQWILHVITDAFEEWNHTEKTVSSAKDKRALSLRRCVISQIVGCDDGKIARIKVSIASPSIILSGSDYQRLLPIRRPQEMAQRKQFSSNSEIIVVKKHLFWV